MPVKRSPADESGMVSARVLGPADHETVIHLIARFRAELRRLRGGRADIDVGAAADELRQYATMGYPVFVAESDQGAVIGYLVCRVEGETVWVESLYVAPAYRRRGIASALHAEAEQLAEQLGGDTVYNWVHPDNAGIIRFLRQRGYSVLNLIEVRRPRRDETLGQRIRVGDHEFDY